MIKPLFLGRLQIGLYYVQDLACKEYECSTAKFYKRTVLGEKEFDIESISKAKLWHIRHGHIPFSLAFCFLILLEKILIKITFVLFAP